MKGSIACLDNKHLIQLSVITCLLILHSLRVIQYVVESHLGGLCNKVDEYFAVSEPPNPRARATHDGPVEKMNPQERAVHGPWTVGGSPACF